MIEEAALARALLNQFHVPIFVRVVDAPFSPDRLTPGEVSELSGMTAPARRDSWLRGRSALKRVLADLEESQDTSALRFPRPRLSLTHSGRWAVAVGTPWPGAKGIGVDLEIRESVRPEVAGRFLSDPELAWLESIDEPARPRELLRLWTMKEAAYKADPENVGTSFRLYETADPAQRNGRLVRRDTGGEFQYVSFDLPEGALTVALLHGG